MQGRVKWFNAEKGYGFIERDDGPDFRPLHCHSDRRIPHLNQGDAVGFDDGPKGLQAANVVKLCNKASEKAPVIRGFSIFDCCQDRGLHFWVSNRGTGTMRSYADEPWP